MVHILFALLALLQAGDWLTTARALAHGKREGNPLMRWLIERIGLHPALALKTAFVLAIGWMLVREGLVIPLALICAIYAWVCWHNWRIVK